MQPQPGASRQVSASRVSRQEIRGLIASMRDAGLWSSHLDGPFPSAAAVDAMIEPVLADPERLDAVYAVSPDGTPNPELDRLAMLAALALGTPYAAVTLVSADCQIVAGCYVGDGEMPTSMPLEQSLCKFAVASGEPFFVEDARQNPLTAENSLVRAGSLRAYAGVPLADGRGMAVGALACWDSKPRLWTTGHIQILSDLGSVAESKVFGV